MPKIKLIANSKRDAKRMITEYFSRPGAKIARKGSFAACLYRTPDGHACAVGCLISDDDYTPELEGLGTIEDLIDNDYIAKPPKALYNFLIDAQLAHDEARSVESFLSVLQKM